MKTVQIGDRVIIHEGYGFLAEMEWTARGWHTVRSDGPYMSAFTDEERRIERETRTRAVPT